MPRITLLAAMAVVSTAAQAGDFYASVGLPGAVMGYAQPVSERVALRADMATLGRHERQRTEQGIDYEGALKSDRLGVFADWFVAGGGFRLTGGVTLFDARLDLNGRGNGGTITIGRNTYVTSSDDRFDVTVTFPRTTPYLGFGYASRSARATGWNFVLDVGASIGKPRVRGTASGPLLSNTVMQDDIDRELAELRESFDRVKAVPQLTLGASYRF